MTGVPPLVLALRRLRDYVVDNEDIIHRDGLETFVSEVEKSVEDIKHIVETDIAPTTVRICLIGVFNVRLFCV